jgi:hypothetical protein
VQKLRPFDPATEHGVLEMTIELQAGRALFVVLPPEPPRRLNRHAVSAMSAMSKAGRHSMVVAPLTQLPLDLELPVIDQLGPGDAMLVALNAGERASRWDSGPPMRERDV